MFSNLKSRLFVWYIVSLLLMTIFVILVVHVFAFKNGVLFLALLFFTLAIFGFTIIYKITKSLTYLSSRMKMISSKNLDDRILDIQSKDEIGELGNIIRERGSEVKEGLEACIFFTLESSEGVYARVTTPIRNIK